MSIESRPLPVLTDEVTPPEFRDAILNIGPEWTSTYGRRYRLEFQGTHLVVSLVVPYVEVLPSGDMIDNDLLELACTVFDAVGEPWSSEILKRTAIAYGWYGRPFAEAPTVVNPGS
jgi:hypothetical protein